MKIFLIWLGLICCGIANGFLCEKLMRPMDILIMAIPCLASLWLLVLHRRLTTGWKAYPDPWSEGFRFPYFRISLFFSVFILIMLFILKEANSTGIVACISVALTSFVGYIRESRYTDDWI